MSASARPRVGYGGLVSEAGVPSRPYIGASPGCWAVFLQVCGKEYGDYRYAKVPRLIVDAYTAQHPGTSSRRSMPSVALHLLELYLQLERGLPPEKVAAAQQRLATLGKEGRLNFIWLEPPDSAGDLSVLYTDEARDPAEYSDRGHEWAGSVWEAWPDHPETVRLWAGA